MVSSSENQFSVNRSLASFVKYSIFKWLVMHIPVSQGVEHAGFCPS